MDELFHNLLGLQSGFFTDFSRNRIIIRYRRGLLCLGQLHTDVALYLRHGHEEKLFGWDHDHTR